MVLLFLSQGVFLILGRQNKSNIQTNRNLLDLVIQVFICLFNKKRKGRGLMIWKSIILALVVVGASGAASAQVDTCLSIDCSPQNDSPFGDTNMSAIERYLEVSGGRSGFDADLCGATLLCEDGQDLESCYADCNTIHDLLLDRCRAMRFTHDAADRQACWAEAADTLDTCRRRCEGR